MAPSIGQGVIVKTDPPHIIRRNIFHAYLRPVILVCVGAADNFFECCARVIHAERSITFILIRIIGWGHFPTASPGFIAHSPKRNMEWLFMTVSSPEISQCARARKI